MSMSFKEVEDNNLIEQRIINSINNKCWCGKELVFSDSLTQLMCKDSECCEKITFRAIKMLEQLGLNNIDSEEVSLVVKAYKIKTPYQLFIISQLGETDTEIGLSEGTVDKLTSFVRSDIDIVKLVQIGNFRYVSKVADKLFIGYKSIESAYNEFEKFQLPIIADKLGVYNTEALIIPMLIYQTLIRIKDELLFASKIFNVTSECDSAIRIAVSSDLGEYINKQMMISKITKEYDRQFIIDSRVSDNTDILIWNNNIESVKYRNAVLVNKKYGYDKVNIIGVGELHGAINKKIAAMERG